MRDDDPEPVVNGSTLRRTLRAAVAAATLAAAMVLTSTALADLTSLERLAELFEGQPIIVNSKAGEYIVRGENLVPGQKVRGQVRIKNKGRGVGILYVRPRRAVDTPGPWGGELSQKLVLTIRRINRDGSLHTVWRGHLATMGRVRLAVLRPGAVRRYRFVVAFQMRPPARGYVVANSYQLSRFKTAFVWQLVPIE
jgi:hypothetical protein